MPTVHSGLARPLAGALQKRLASPHARAFWQTWAMADVADALRTYWNDRGPVWVEYRERLDTMLATLGEAAIARLHPDPGEHVLDIGCGTGTTSLELARLVGQSGQVTGVDVSAPMLDAAPPPAPPARVGHTDLVVGDSGAPQ
ncbi:MAG: class I SAM-dependent methyltransferase, partial [bacterium]|nr:class I SAM-dependent methyltransferase [bacterium]